MCWFWFVNCRYVGFSRPGPDATEVPVRADGSRVGERGTEAQVEVAADPAEQRGLLWRLHLCLAHLCNPVMTVWAKWWSEAQRILWTFDQSTSLNPLTNKGEKNMHGQWTSEGRFMLSTVCHCASRPAVAHASAVKHLKCQMHTAHNCWFSVFLFFFSPSVFHATPALWTQWQQ